MTKICCNKIFYLIILFTYYIMMKYGADVNELMLKSREGNLEDVKFLVSKGVDINETDEDGNNQSSSL